jgi:NAD(P)-dependent dehydrogenase (short-subunit alcohol dehydrogenase family)
MGLEGRVALISGGGRGIGASIALALAEDGADIAVNYRKDEASANETVAAIEKLGRKARAYQASVDDPEQSAQMAEAALADFGFVDILVNNAGIASRGQNVAGTEVAEFERVWRTHTLSAFVLSKLLLPSMRERPRGDIVMISSAATNFMAGYSSPYNVAKASLEALASTIAKEERGNGIRVNVVAPGLVETEMGRRLVKATRGVEDIHELDATMPFGHVCTPEEVAGVVRFVVSDAGGYLTDQKIYVDGGSF